MRVLPGPVCHWAWCPGPLTAPSAPNGGHHERLPWLAEIPSKALLTCLTARRAHAGGPPAGGPLRPVSSGCSLSTLPGAPNDAPMAVKRFLFVLILLTAGGVAGLRTRQGWATKAGSYEVTPSRSGRRPGGGRRIVRRPAPGCGSRLAGQAAPGVGVVSGAADSGRSRGLRSV